MHRRRRSLPVACLAIAMLASPAAASGDLTGRYNVVIPSLFGTVAGTFVFEQSGPAVSLVYDVTNALSGRLTATLAGTFDPDTRTFSFPTPDVLRPPFPLPPCTGNGIFGTVALDGQTISGSWVASVPAGPPHIDLCVNALGPFTGTRNPAVCGDGVVGDLEQCDDGNTADGDCCSSACVYEPSGTHCDDGNACTLNLCDGAGACSISYPVHCGPCEICAPASGCVVAPDPHCPTTDGRAKLSLNLAAKRLEYSARRRAAIDVVMPKTVDDQAICVFTPAGDLVYSVHVPVFDGCPGGSCWQLLRSGSRYRNASGTPDGVSLLVLRPGGRRAVSLQASGANLPVAPLPDGPSALHVQVHGRGTCTAADLDYVTLPSPFRLHAWH